MLTGTGHLRAAQAIQAALIEMGVETDIDTSYTEFGPFPHKYSAELYSIFIRYFPLGWEFFFRWFEHPTGYWFVTKRIYGHNEIWFDGINAANYDTLICTHPGQAYAITHFAQKLGKNRPRTVNVVLDIRRVYRHWLLPDFDITFVPNDYVAELAQSYGVPADTIFVAGLPYASGFGTPSQTAGLHERLGLRDDLPIVVVMGGGEGAGRIGEIVQAFDRERVNAHLVVITGRNKRLYQSLTSQQWQLPVSVLGYVENVSDYLTVADLLISKAGPGTLNEACITGTPVIIYGNVMGQESGNVDYIVSGGGGVYEPRPRKVATLVTEWLAAPHLLEQMAANVRQLAHPNAVPTVVQTLYGQPESIEQLA
jgi:1,2-diacylglycerol 3-beta-galactosyltransferase